MKKLIKIFTIVAIIQALNCFSASINIGFPNEGRILTTNTIIVDTGYSNGVTMSGWLNTNLLSRATTNDLTAEIVDRTAGDLALTNYVDGSIAGVQNELYATNDAMKVYVDSQSGGTDLTTVSNQFTLKTVFYATNDAMKSYVDTADNLKLDKTGDTANTLTITNLTTAGTNYFLDYTYCEKEVVIRQQTNSNGAIERCLSIWPFYLTGNEEVFIAFEKGTNTTHAGVPIITMENNVGFAKMKWDNLEHWIFTCETGSIIFENLLSMGGNKITNLADGVNSKDAVNVSQLTSATNNCLQVSNQVYATASEGYLYSGDSTGTDVSIRVPAVFYNDHIVTIADHYTATVAQITANNTFIINTEAKDITLYLPSSADFPLDNLYELDVRHPTGTNSVCVQLLDNDVFAYSNNWFDLGDRYSGFKFGVGHFSSGLSKWGLLRSLTIRASGQREASWSSANFTSMTVVPLDNEEYNTNTQLLYYTDGASAGYEVVTPGDYEVSYVIIIDSTGGGTYNVTAKVYKTPAGGTAAEVENTETRDGNYGGEDCMVTLPTSYIHLEAGDKIDLRIDQNNLTGNLLHAMLNIKIRL